MDVADHRSHHRSDHRFPFSVRLVALTAATLVLAVLLAATSILATRPTRRSLGDVVDVLLPASTALDQVVSASQRAQQEFVLSLATSGADRQDHIAESQRYGNVAATHWADYQVHALGTPAEIQMIREYDEATKQSQEAGATAFALADSPDLVARQEAVGEQASTAARAAEIAAQIRSRFYTPRISDRVDESRRELADARVWVVVATGVVVVAVIAGGILLVRAARRDEAVLAAEEQVRREEARRSTLETQLQRGLEMEPTEDAIHDVVEAALRMVRPEAPVELLVADAANGRFRRALTTDPAGLVPDCPVSTPADCPAASSGQTRVFPSSERLDACPHLRERALDGASAACVPVNIAGTTTGVLHTLGPEQVVPDSNELAELELVARKTGERIGYLRVLARSEMQARVDPLTGLVNRRSLEDRVRMLVDEATDFTIAFVDLDHFKDLNDTFGHETGDRALRLFGRVLRETVRPSDVVARYGGEEFVVVLPDTPLVDARTVADRIRERLRRVADGTSVPPFTVSIGLAEWEPPEDFSDTVARADTAMLYAKAAGRDRVVTSAELPMRTALDDERKWVEEPHLEP